MIKNLEVRNFKSLKDFTLSCKRVNLFIGEPNTGKSNILESVSLFSFPYNHDLKPLIRSGDLSNLFFENDVTNEILIRADSLRCKIQYEASPDNKVKFEYYKGNDFVDEILIPIMHHYLAGGEVKDLGIHPYFFKPLGKFERKTVEFLFPPNGDNLFFLLQTNKSLKNIISDFVQEKGFKLTFRQATFDIEISKEENNVLTTYPYSTISDTLQRIIFYVSAIESNKKDTTLIFEEPESSVFPYYTKYLAEKIARDRDRQYFLTTHNPYFLQSIVEKTPIEELSVNLVRMIDYQTKVDTLTKEGVARILDLNSDVFLNFEHLLEA